MEELLNQIKINLRENSTAFDEAEIMPLIKAAVLDMQRMGIAIDIDNIQDELLRQAVVFYCKGYYGYDENAARFIKAYEDLRDTLALSSKYRAVK